MVHQVVTFRGAPYCLFHNNYSWIQLKYLLLRLMFNLSRPNVHVHTLVANSATLLTDCDRLSHTVLYDGFSLHLWRVSLVEIPGRDVLYIV